MRPGTPAGPCKHVHERWQQEHGGTRSSSWTKKTLQAAGQVTRAPRRGAHRKKRPRTPLPGMMLHQDGSTHEWVPGCQGDLIVTLDDATSEISSAFVVEEEGTLSSFRGLQEGIETQGLFSSLYTDRGSHYWHTDEAGGKVDKTRLTPGASRRAATRDHADSCLFTGGAGPVGAGLPHPPGPTPPGVGPGRDDRDGGGQSVSDRAVPPAAITPRFMVRGDRSRAPPLSRGLAHTSPRSCGCKRSGSWPRTIRCGIRARPCKSRKIPHRFHDVKVTVRVHEYPDGTLAVLHGPRCRGARPRGWSADRDRRCPPSPSWPDPRIEHPADRRS